MRMIGSAARSRGRCGSPYFASSAGWAQATIRMVPRRVATMLLSAVANPHRQIDMVAHQVGIAIAEQQTDAN